MFRQAPDGKKGEPGVRTALSCVVVQGAKGNTIMERHELQREGVWGQSGQPQWVPRKCTPQAYKVMREIGSLGKRGHIGKYGS